MGETTHIASLKARIGRLSLREEAAIRDPMRGGLAIVGRASSGARCTSLSPETSAREARARAWLYVFECYERKKADAGVPVPEERRRETRMIAARTAHKANQEIPPSPTLLPRDGRRGSS